MAKLDSLFHSITALNFGIRTVVVVVVVFVLELFNSFSMTR